MIGRSWASARIKISCSENNCAHPARRPSVRSAGTNLWLEASLDVLRLPPASYLQTSNSLKPLTTSTSPSQVMAAMSSRAASPPLRIPLPLQSQPGTFPSTSSTNRSLPFPPCVAYNLGSRHCPLGTGFRSARRISFISRRCPAARINPIRLRPSRCCPSDSRLRRIVWLNDANPWLAANG